MRNDLFEYKNTKDGIAIKAYIGNKNRVSIPKIIDGKTVTKILDGAFLHCHDLVSVEIPESVLELGERIFSFCYNLIYITVAPGNKRYHSKDNCVIETKTNILKVGCKNSIIPNYVTSINADAFRGCYLTDIEIPESVTSIGEYAFAGCQKIKQILIPSSVTSIGEGAFQDCYKLVDIGMLGSVTSIPNSAFEGCIKLNKISLPNSLISIGTGAFRNCQVLKSIEIPESVTSIENGAFSSCQGLTSVVHNKIIENFKMIFDGCKIKERQFLKDNGLHKKIQKREQITNIIEKKDANRIMGKCTNGVLIIPEGITTIGEGAFCKRTSIKSIIFPNSLRIIGEQAFASCSSLKSIEIPEGVTTIGASAFTRCYTLKSISIPSSVISIGADAFYDCDELRRVNITSLSAWLNINFADAYANPLCVVKGWGVLRVEKSNYKKLYLNDQLLNEITIPEEITEIKPFSFSGYKTLSQISFHNKITSIGDSAFNKCSGLTSIEIPLGVTNIGDSAFNECTNLTSAVISSSVIRIGNAAFNECSKLTSIVIPSGVTSIGDSAFNKCSGLTSIEIPKSVTSIGEGAFRCCKNLTKIEIPDGVKNIGGNAFEECINLTNISIPSSVTSLGKAAFSNCPRLMQIMLAKENKKYSMIENYLIGTETNELLFACKNIENAVIPNNINRIGDNAFEDCQKLKNISIPNGVISIGDSAFDGCRSLTSIEIPESVTSIGEYAFANCSKLTNITIPSNVERLGNEALFSTGITEMTIKNPRIKLGESLFGTTEYLYQWTSYEESDLESLTVPVGFRVTKKSFGVYDNVIINYVHFNKPTSSLDENGEKIYDYIDKQIKVKLLSNMKFECFDLSNNKKIKTLPRATKKEDANLVNGYIEDFRHIKKEVEEKVEEYQPEIIKALNSGAEFSIEAFNSMFVNTITTIMATGVLWGLYDHNDNLKCAFRVIDKNNFIDLNGNKVAIGEDDILSIVDASQLSMSEVNQWKHTLWEDNKPQLVRQFESPIYYVPLDKLKERYHGATLANHGMVSTPYITLWGSSKASSSLVIQQISIKPFNIDALDSHEKRLLNRSIIEADKASLADKRIENLVSIGDLQGIKNAKEEAAITVDNIAHLSSIAIEHENAEVTAYLMNLKREMLGDIVDLDWEI